LMQYPMSTRHTPRTHRHWSITTAEPIAARTMPE
jgi:hypothetical protein